MNGSDQVDQVSEETKSEASEKAYRVSAQGSAEEWSKEVTARNGGEAVWLAHASRDEESGAQYTVSAVDGSERARNFTVGQSRSEAPYSG